MRTAGKILSITVGALALLAVVPTIGRAQEESYTATERTETTETTEGPHSSLTLYGGLFGNKAYVQGWEGVAASIGVHERVSLLGRVTGLHVIDSDRFREGDTGIGEGGLAFHVAPNTSLSVLGGSYFGQFEDPIIDGSFDTAQLFGDRWVSFSFGGLYGFDSNRWQATGYVSTPITDPREDVTLFGGVESVIYNEGRFLNRANDEFEHNPESRHVKFQVGPVLALYKKSWEAGLRLGVGGGDYGVYGTMSLWKTFSF